MLLICLHFLLKSSQIILIILIMRYGLFFFWYNWIQFFSRLDKLMPFSLTGLEALEKALYCWEDALTAFSSTLGNDTLALPSKADAAFTHDVQELLDMGYQIQSHAELLFLDQVWYLSLLSINSQN